MYSLAAEILRFLVFMYFILLIVYGRRDRNVGLLNQYVYERGGFSSADIAVTSPPDVYDFVQTLLDENLYSYDEDGNVLILETGYLFTALRLRQFRAHPNATCDLSWAPGIRCSRKDDLDRNSYQPSWAGVDDSVNSTYAGTEWWYNSANNFPSYRCKYCFTPHHVPLFSLALKIHLFNC